MARLVSGSDSMSLVDARAAESVRPRPKALGNCDLDYDMAGSRLRHVAGELVEYDKLGNRPVRVGDLELENGRLGNRLVRIGNIDIEYDMVGNRVRRIGGVTVDYDKMGSRPRHLETDGDSHLDEQMLLVVFLVLIAFNRDD